MQRAWQQLGDILRANQKIRQTQVSIAASLRLYQKHLLSMDLQRETQQLRLISLTPGAYPCDRQQRDYFS
jgi:hypothetical protein